MIDLKTTPCGVYTIKYRGCEETGFAVIGRSEDGIRWIAAPGWKDGSVMLDQHFLDELEGIELLHRDDPWADINETTY